MKPCDTCDRVMDPANCENKCCQDWRQWWIKRWEEIRKRLKDGVRRCCVLSVEVIKLWWLIVDHNRTRYEEEGCVRIAIIGLQPLRSAKDNIKNWPSWTHPGQKSCCGSKVVQDVHDVQDVFNFFYVFNKMRM